MISHSPWSKVKLEHRVVVINLALVGRVSHGVILSVFLNPWTYSQTHSPMNATGFFYGIPWGNTVLGHFSALQDEVKIGSCGTAWGLRHHTMANFVSDFTYQTCAI